MRKLRNFIAPKFPPMRWEESPAPEAITARRSLRDGDKQIFVKDGERCWIVQVRDIILIESEGNYSRISFGANRAMMYHSLNYFQGVLDPEMFLRANRHAIINLRHIERIEPWMNGGFLVRLSLGCEIEVSRRQARILKHRISL
jgi:two-component system LytT family response regulator